MLRSRKPAFSFTWALLCVQRWWWRCTKFACCCKNQTSPASSCLSVQVIAAVHCTSDCIAHLDKLQGSQRPAKPWPCERGQCSQLQKALSPLQAFPQCSHSRAEVWTHSFHRSNTVITSTKCTPDCHRKLPTPVNTSQATTSNRDALWGVPSTHG